MHYTELYALQWTELGILHITTIHNAIYNSTTARWLLLLKPITSESQAVGPTAKSRTFPIIDYTSETLHRTALHDDVENTANTVQSLTFYRLFNLLLKTC